MKVKRIILVCVTAILLIGVTVAWNFYGKLQAEYQGEKVRIYIPTGIDRTALRDTLVKHLGSFGDEVMWAYDLRKANIDRAHGSYVIDTGETVKNVSRRLMTGNQTPIRVTFNNIRTLNQLADRLSSKMEWGSDDFLAACDSVLPPKGFTRAQYPAAFLPDTYEFFWTTSAVDVVKRLFSVRDAFWNDQRRNQAVKINLTPVQVATLASIVEEETAKSDERPKVARLYLNRLDRSMLLQADPTVKFALGDFGLKRIYNYHLDIDSPYNTYRYTGLPPGPIRIPERSTLEAVLEAPSHNYIYMCAKEDFSGYHNFATDLATHNQNAARYHRALSQRNIR